MAAVQQQNLVQGSVPWAIGSWIATNFVRVIDAKQLRGGWEKWAQVELAMWMNVPNMSHTPVREEANIWPNTTANPDAANWPIDIWLGRNAGINNVNNFGIELKCRSQRENTQTFRTRYIADVVRVQAVTVQNRMPVTMYAVAITDDLADLANYDIANVQNAQANTIKYYTIRPWGWNGAPIYLIWREW